MVAVATLRGNNMIRCVTTESGSNLGEVYVLLRRYTVLFVHRLHFEDR